MLFFLIGSALDGGPTFSPLLKAEAIAAMAGSRFIIERASQTGPFDSALLMNSLRSSVYPEIQLAHQSFVFEL